MLAGEDRKFSALMMNVGFTEKVTIGGIERGFVQRSCSSICHYESEQRCKVDLQNYTLQSDRSQPRKMCKPVI